jgi:shikimate kinase
VQGLAIGGFMGVGKSTVGTIVAARVGLPFVDMDTVLVARHGVIAEQFRVDGEAIFRRRELELAYELCDGKPRVVSTGGGVWASVVCRSALRAAYVTVVLHAGLDTLQSRLGSGPGRPLWSSASTLWRARQEAYAQSDGAFVTDDVPMAVVADRVEAWWRTQ